MKKVIFAISLLNLMFSSSAFAGESGFIKNGQTHIVYKDGKKVGEWPNLPAKTTKDRIPSSTREPDDYTVSALYEDDGFARCYFTKFTNSSVIRKVESGSPVFCVKK